jgi:hypothetical protein
LANTILEAQNLANFLETQSLVNSILEAQSLVNSIPVAQNLVNPILEAPWGPKFGEFHPAVYDTDFFPGYLGPAGLANDGAYPAECIGGATGYVDRLILGTNHIYGYPTAKDVYETGPFDPEGIVGTFLLLTLWNL